MAAIAALLYGLICYVLFFGTFLYSIAFVGGVIVPKHIDSGAEPFALSGLLVNLLLLGVFAVQHSVMARPAFKRAWTQIVPECAERSTYVLLSTAALALLLWQWRAIEGVVWQVTNPAGVAVLWAVFLLGWSMLLLATFMIDHFDLFGLRQVWLFARGKPYRPPEFQTTGFYKHVRHPIMLGFLIAFWSAPVMTAGHLLFAIGTTGYILIGIVFEERDLLRDLDERYRRYRATVPMLIPGMGRRVKAERGTSGAGTSR